MEINIQGLTRNLEKSVPGQTRKDRTIYWKPGNVNLATESLKKHEKANALVIQNKSSEPTFNLKYLKVN